MAAIDYLPVVARFHRHVLLTLPVAQIQMVLEISHGAS
jgi:hypothetical protein